MRFTEINKPEKETAARMTFADKVLLCIFIIIPVLGFVLIGKLIPKGIDVIVEVDGVPAYKLPLNADTSISVKGRLGHTVIEIKNNKVHIKESPCENKICIKSGWTDRGAVICLPNRVVVRIISPQENNDRKIDAVTG
ncbi:MAG: NusG domain II-containing protein [Nitrospiraceae bacterium]|nr:NusG domain II-containing protein [Nitrospiraceae bacterium]